MRILSKEEINPDVIHRLSLFEQGFWPKGSDGYLSEEYLAKTFLPNPETLWLYVDDQDHIVGEFYVIFPSKPAFQEYMRTGDFMKLDNPVFTGTDKLLYIYSVLLSEEYRGKGYSKLLVQPLRDYLLQKEKEGCRIQTAYAEAVTPMGAHFARKCFGMEPMSDVNEEGIGHYIARDGLYSWLHPRETVKAQ